ncbi:hypothetical protein TL5118_03961 [Thalassovita autumnalis]|uniref:DUF3179 domain-containing protein n=1 Tax=Thalassovita autumnalis TaxID=2072972 RepID=A0A0P1FTY4_9RHOB|nr:DUF3179 domain-containing (seleno)protein [Thalassovita autumnalis]CUH69989.1 hypothetical protein TL5118_03961 [Thalassovita autumnalis]CUH72381.1 hypothetical protein TL5120_02180 [Thalassovita autumnalis]
MLPYRSVKSVTLALSLALGVGLGLGGAAMAQSQLPDHVVSQFGAPPPVPAGELPPDLAQAVQVAFVDSITQSGWGPDQTIALETIKASGDPRLAWIISDLLRFVTNRDLSLTLADTAAALLQVDAPRSNPWGAITDPLIAWDIPAPPDYLAIKRQIFTTIIPGWDQIFVDGDVDWRLVSWGGVLIDDRPFDTTDERCNCIPAADNPATTDAEGATWLQDDDIIFGIEINGEARAYPRQIMEVREMVNDTLGGRDLGIPYCTLCGAAQAYFTDQLPAGIKRPVLRTSGLLSRSNKVMYDLTSWSVFDTFTGEALTGPLAQAGIQLDQATVVTSTWGAWKAAYPETTVLAEYLALGRDPDFRNTRDANGPIFPVGDVDPRLPIQEDIVGVITPSGQPVAFPRALAMAALQKGEAVTHDGVTLAIDAGGLRALGPYGGDLGSHQAFWFAWSQFHPDTVLWPQ